MFSVTSNVLEKALKNEELSFNDGLELFNEDIFMLGKVADEIRKRLKNDMVTFTVSYYINYTNICAANCPICAFYRKKYDKDAYALNIDEILRRVNVAVDLGASEIHIVGGFNPDLKMEYYEQMIKAIKSRFNRVTVKALTPAEIFFISKVTRNSIREVLSRLKDAGLDALPGGGAEIFHEDVRKYIVKGKCSGDEWLKVAEEAHNLGIKSNCTMLYGHIEEPKHIIDHILRLRELQKRSNGFLTFIPLRFSANNTELAIKGMVIERSSLYDLRVISIARLLLANYINNISVYWIALGKKLAQIALAYGGNDLVGTAFEEEIFSATGLKYNISIEELSYIIKSANRIPAQRDTFHNIIKQY
ncbi:MAG: CofH family radical SAM protein [Candidatus Nitrosocaldaceae archaeon]